MLRTHQNTGNQAIKLRVFGIDTGIEIRGYWIKIKAEYNKLYHNLS